MTPHQELKAKYGYIKKANCCGNCVNFEPARLLGRGGVVKADLQDKSTCAIGNFPVSAKAWCTRHKSLKMEEDMEHKCMELAP